MKRKKPVVKDGRTEKTQMVLEIPNCKKCHLTYFYQFHTHFMRLILCDEHYAHLNVDKPEVKKDVVV